MTKTEEELIKIMEYIRDERKNVMGEGEEEKAQRLDEVLSQVHEKINNVISK